MTWIMESDEWGAGPSILAAGVLAQIEAVVEVTAIIVEHAFYRGASAPERRIFEAYEDFLTYTQVESRPGDIFRIWRFDELCRDDNAVIEGKVPDAAGRVPKFGPY